MCLQSMAMTETTSKMQTSETPREFPPPQRQTGVGDTSHTKPQGCKSNHPMRESTLSKRRLTRMSEVPVSNPGRGLSLTNPANPEYRFVRHATCPCARACDSTPDANSRSAHGSERHFYRGLLSLGRFLLTEGNDRSYTRIGRRRVFTPKGDGRRPTHRSKYACVRYPISRHSRAALRMELVGLWVRTSFLIGFLNPISKIETDLER